LQIDGTIALRNIHDLLPRFFELSRRKLDSIFATWKPEDGSPVFTAGGRYTSQGWTEWTQGFMFGWALLQFEATGDERYLEKGRSGVVQCMAPHVSHTGVHDHGFNNISTYGNLRRLMLKGRIPHNEWELRFYEMALKVSGAVQASRWSTLADGTGYIYSFNGPHSLFIDTIRSLRSLMAAYELGHELMGEGDRRISLLERIVHHALNTARYNIYYGEGRDAYDVRGRVAHESIFNMNNGVYRCPNSQQGYSPFSTWTRGLAWAILGFAELMEFFSAVPREQLEPWGGFEAVFEKMRKAATATADFYIDNTALDGVPYWDTGAPGLKHLGDWRSKPADPHNEHEPVDSSAAAIAAQGLLRIGRCLKLSGDSQGRTYTQAGLTVAGTIFRPPYLSESDAHQGLLLHSVYHRPNGWDHVPAGSRIPCGESCMWGDYHAMELALYLKRMDYQPDV
jgi:hypothetical protein